MYDLAVKWSSYANTDKIFHIEKYEFTIPQGDQYSIEQPFIGSGGRVKWVEDEPRASTTRFQAWWRVVGQESWLPTSGISGMAYDNDYSVAMTQGPFAGTTQLWAFAYNPVPSQVKLEAILIISATDTDRTLDATNATALPSHLRQKYKTMSGLSRTIGETVNVDLPPVKWDGRHNHAKIKGSHIGLYNATGTNQLLATIPHNSGKIPMIDYGVYAFGGGQTPQSPVGLSNIGRDLVWVSKDENNIRIYWNPYGNQPANPVLAVEVWWYE